MVSMLQQLKHLQYHLADFTDFSDLFFKDKSNYHLATKSQVFSEDDPNLHLHCEHCTHVRLLVCSKLALLRPRPPKTSRPHLNQLEDSGVVPPGLVVSWGFAVH